MEQREFSDFAQVYDDVMGFYGKGAVASQKVMFFRAMSGHSLAEVRAAFDAHVKDTERGRFAPLPADLLAQIERNRQADGRPTADEAWPIALASADESRTVVWSSETAEAWGIARPVYLAGDEVGARMAFKAAYARLVSEARAAREQVRWSPSIGHDARLRDESLRQAVEAGRLPVAYLPAPNPQPVAGLLELSRVRGIPESVRAKLLEIRSQIAMGKGGPSDDAVAKAATASAKDITAEAVRRYQGGSDAAV